MTRMRLLAIGFSATAGLAAGVAHADESWDGTWTSGIAEVWSPARLYFAGNKLLGFFWNADFLPDFQGSMSTSDGVMTITWNRGQAILTRDGPHAAHLLVEQKGKADITLNLTSDE